jgi:hypothetical protein
VHHGRGTSGVGTEDDVTTIGKTDQRIDIGLVGVSRERIDEEDDPAQILHTHQCRNLGISPERTRSARLPVMNGGVILPPHRLTHHHRRLRAGDTELLEDLRICLNKLLHGRLHVIMCHECQLTHLGGFKLGVEGRCDFICFGADLLGNGEPVL